MKEKKTLKPNLTTIKKKYDLVRKSATSINSPLYQLGKAIDGCISQLQDIFSRDFSPCKACTPESAGGCRICIKELVEVAHEESM